MPHIILSAPGDLAMLATRWQALEACAGGSFFQSWTWVGCDIAARYPDPVLVEAREGGRTVGLALCNVRRDWLGERWWLGESGAAGLDSLFVEHNGPLVAEDAGPGVLAGMLAAMAGGVVPGRRGFGRRVMLGGVAAEVAASAWAMAGTLRVQPDRPSPYVDFTALRADGISYLGSLSANARQQLRRSGRRYAADGALTLTRAGDVAEGLAFLEALAGLHQATWTGRGRPGAFAVPEFRRFHAELIARALPRGEVELVRVSAGDVVIGYLYNFLWRGWVLAYQSGFVYPAGDTHRKPGLTCHHLAIEDHLAAGAMGYDFLAGEARYKSSLANASQVLSWLELGPAWRPDVLLARLRRTG